jgi:hypothetical protein
MGPFKFKLCKQVNLSDGIKLTSSLVVRKFFFSVSIGLKLTTSIMLHNPQI